MSKIGRNDLCPCNSQKKYKKCCFLKPQFYYDIGNENSNEHITSLKDILSMKFPKHKIIDISNTINNDNYIEYLRKNYHEKIIMLVHKNESNNELFTDKIRDSSDDIMILYKGGYRIINSNMMINYIMSIEEFIKEKN